LAPEAAAVLVAGPVAVTVSAAAVVAAVAGHGRSSEQLRWIAMNP